MIATKQLINLSFFLLLIQFSSMTKSNIPTNDTQNESSNHNFDEETLNNYYNGYGPNFSNEFNDNDTIDSENPTKLKKEKEKTKENENPNKIVTRSKSAASISKRKNSPKNNNSNKDDGITPNIILLETDQTENNGTTPSAIKNTNNTSSNSTNSQQANNTTANNQTLSQVQPQLIIVDKAFNSDQPQNKIKMIESFIFFIALVLIIKTVFGSIKNIPEFIDKSKSILYESSFTFYFFAGVLFLIFADVSESLKFSWGSLFVGIFYFIIIWFLIGYLLILFCYLISNKFTYLEENTKSFKSIKDSYEKADLENYKKNIIKSNFDASEYFELFEYRKMKINFIVPFFATFKASSLRKDFDFSAYLNLSLINQLRKFFNVSLLAWIILLVGSLTWNVWISNESVLFRIVFMSLIPLVGVLILLLIFLYMKVVYNRVSKPVDQGDMYDFVDLQTYNQSNALSLSKLYPIYIDKQLKRPVYNPGFTFTEHFDSRTPSFYEDIIIFGVSGRYILLNIMQGISLLFALYLVTVVMIDCPAFVDAYGGYLTILFVVLGLSYLILIAYITALCLKWLTIYSSTEMNKNDITIKECINNQLVECGKKSNIAFNSFKKLYFDMMISLAKNNKGVVENFNSLNNSDLQKLIDIQIIRFKKIDNNSDKFFAGNINDSGFSKIDREEYQIQIDHELKHFLASCGNNLSDEDIEFMIHLVEDFDSINNSSLTCRQFYDIWGALIHFSSKEPNEILKFVFKVYFEEKGLDINSHSSSMSVQIIEDFLKWYKEYFDSKTITFLLNETSYIGKEFSLDSFICSITGARRYYAN